MQDVRATQNAERKGLSFFRRSRAPTPSPDNKSSRFTLFRNNGRRSGAVLDNDVFAVPKGASPPESSASESESSSSSAGRHSQSSSSAENVDDERTRALLILEGRVQSQAQAHTRPDSEQTIHITNNIANSPVSVNGSTNAVRPVPPPSPTPGTPATGGVMSSFLSRRSTANSVASRRSTSGDEGRRVSSRLGLVPEDGTPLPLPEFEVDEAGLPTYASAAFPSRSVTYRFTQAGPFAMTIAGDQEEVPGLGKYHVSVGLNVWAPRSCVTTIRRGWAEDGPLVAQLESECSSIGATITMGDVSKPVKEVLTKSIMNNSRTYNIGDGVAIVWKIGRTSWKAFLDSALIATFSPSQPRTLTVQPVAHKYLDHLLIAALLLMRDKDDAGSRPDSYGRPWVTVSTVGAVIVEH